MLMTLSTIGLLLAPTTAMAQNVASPPSVADAEANLRRAQQIYEAAKAFQTADRTRKAAEAEATAAARALAALQTPPLSTVAPPPVAATAFVEPTPQPPADLPPATEPHTPVSPSPAAIVAARTGVVTTTTVTDDKVTTEVKPYSPQGLADSQTGRQKFGGIDFGIGIAFSYDLGNNDRIKDADIVGGLLRVKHTDNVRARLILESHYFFTPKLVRFGNYTGAYCSDFLDYPEQHEDCTARRKNFGIGPFMAIQPGGSTIIDAIGAGIMLGFRRREEKASSFNIGIGVLYDLDTQILGDGFVENAPPPGGETEVRFRRQSQSGLLLMSSYTF